MFKEHLGWVLNLLSSSLKFTRKKLGFYWKINTFSFLRILVWHVLQSNPPKSKESGLVQPHPLTVLQGAAQIFPVFSCPTGSIQLGLAFHLYAVEPVIILFSVILVLHATSSHWIPKVLAQHSCFSIPQLWTSPNTRGIK